MELNLQKEVSDVRGKIMFLTFKNKKINIVEIRKGFARGGHYHKFDQLHIILSGKILYKERNLITNEEVSKTVDAPGYLLIPASTAHLFVALDDTIFAEIYDNEYESTNFPPYRNVVEEKMKDANLNDRR
jgi:dTDP-4-dehydrorhamnose 3,5-epimerase-like enzyme